MTEKDPEALILIDVQKGFDDPSLGNRNNPEAEKNIALLLNHWRTQKLPLIHVQHLSTASTSPFKSGQDGCDFKPEAAPLAGEKIITKSVNSAFIGTDLEKYLKTHAYTRLLFVGLTTDHCVSTSVRMGANRGFEVRVVSDATATFDRKGPDGKEFPAQEVHDVALASLHEEFATVLTTQEVLSSS